VLQAFRGYSAEGELI